MQFPHTNQSSEQDGGVIGCTLRHVTRAVSRYPRLTLCLVMLVSFAAAGYTAVCLDFRTQRADLIDPRAEYHQRWMAYTEEFGDQSDIVVVVESDHSDLIRSILDDLGPRLEREPELFSDVLYRIDTSQLRRKGLQYFTPAELQAGLRNLEQFSSAINGRWDQTRLDVQYAAFARELNAEARRHDQLPHQVVTSSEETARLLDRIDQLTESLNGSLENSGGFENPWPRVIPSAVPLATGAVTYLMNKRGTMGFVQVKPNLTEDSSFDGATTAVTRLREIIAEVSERYPETKIGLTGIPVLENDEMRRSQSDMTAASVVSLIAVAVLMFVGFRGLRHPLLSLIMLLVGMTWTFGYTTLVVGHLNILSVSFAVILIGLGIDFAIHYLARYLEIRHRGKELRPALKETSSSVGTGIVTAALTTALAFFCATFTDFLGVAELGIIAGGGILICAACTFLVLPALVALSDGDLAPKQLPAPFDFHILRNFIARFPRLVAIASIVLVVGFGSQVVSVNDGFEWKIRYDSNLLNLQAKGIDSVDVQQRMFEQSDHSLLYAVSVAESPEEARRLRHEFEKLPTVDRVEDLASRLPTSSIAETQPSILAFRQRLSRLPRQIPLMPQLNPASCGRQMEATLQALRRVRHPDATAAAAKVDQFLDRFEALSLDEQSKFLMGFQQRATGALLFQLHGLLAATETAPLGWDDLPTQLQNRFVSNPAEGESRKWLLQIYPKDEIWDADPLAHFVQDLRSVDPNVTGTPLQNHEASRQIQQSYRNASLYALAVVLIVLLMDFLCKEQKLLVLLPPLAVVVFAAMMLQTRRIEISPTVLISAYLVMIVASASILDYQNLRDALLAMVPPVAGGLLMFGWFAVFGIDLNPANLIVLPLVLGIGVDDGVHVVHDFRLQRGTRYRTSSSTMNAITLTSLTTMAGFGSMLMAAHRGLASVGLVLVIGVGGCLFVSLVMLPAMLTCLSSGDAEAEIEDEKLNLDKARETKNQQQSRSKNSRRRAA
ncbi:MMPL family transporter [Thalassoroseus pseudoceratinae]|uniref:MMPL family transporter n=1 Tax=Thalassoroseus pseudoceratinae TaxID=2713176 RepID=UPI001420A42E|nr:MMPL family transporter [Thalassoroseus pseudoceratinae]